MVMFRLFSLDAAVWTNSRGVNAQDYDNALLDVDFSRALELERVVAFASRR